MNTQKLFFSGHGTTHRILGYFLGLSIFLLWPLNPPKTPLPFPPTSYQLSLNQASKDELLCIPGLGEKRAEQILWARQQKGSFNTLEELADIKGIGPRLIHKLSLFVKVP